MSLPRAALVALLVGAALLASTPLLLQFQEPRECANAVEPLDDAPSTDTEATYQYEDLSPAAKRAFDDAQSAYGSVIVTGDACPPEFSYTATQHRYEVVRNGSHYVLTTYQNDLVPEVAIATAATALLGLCLVGIGVLTHDAPAARFPGWAGAVGGVTLLGVATAVVLGQQVLSAAAAVAVVTAATLVATGAAVPARRALLFAGALAVLPAVAAAPFVGLSMVVFVPAALPLVLVGVGIAGRRVLTALRSSRGPA